MKKIIIFKNSIFDFLDKDKKIVETLQELLGEEYIIVTADIEEPIYVKEV